MEADWLKYLACSVAEWNLRALILSQPTLAEGITQADVAGETVRAGGAHAQGCASGTGIEYVDIIEEGVEGGKASDKHELLLSGAGKRGKRVEGTLNWHYAGNLGLRVEGNWLGNNFD